MIFLQIDPSDNRIEFIHYQPFDPKHGMNKTEEQLLREGILVEYLPEPIEQEGKASELRYNGVELFYEYFSIPKGEVEQLRDEMNNGLMELSMLIAMTGGLNNV